MIVDTEAQRAKLRRWKPIWPSHSNVSGSIRRYYASPQFLNLLTIFMKFQRAVLLQWWFRVFGDLYSMFRHFDCSKVAFKHVSKLFQSFCQLFLVILEEVSVVYSIFSIAFFFFTTLSLRLNVFGPRWGIYMNCACPFPLGLWLYQWWWSSEFWGRMDCITN